MMTRAKRRIVWIVSIAFGLVLLVGVVGPLIPYKRVKESVLTIDNNHGMITNGNVVTAH
jgi:hypothetical protein